MAENNGNMPTWVNGTFILTAMGLLGAGSGYLLSFMLKSRCTNVRCCCISCDRVPLTAEEMRTASIETPHDPDSTIV